MLKKKKPDTFSTIFYSNTSVGGPHMLSIRLPGGANVGYEGRVIEGGRQTTKSQRCRRVKTSFTHVISARVFTVVFNPNLIYYICVKITTPYSRKKTFSFFFSLMSKIFIISDKRGVSKSKTMRGFHHFFRRFAQRSTAGQSYNHQNRGKYAAIGGFAMAAAALQVEENPAGSADEKKKINVNASDMKQIQYENRIRRYSTPDKVFRLFATVQVMDKDANGEMFETIYRALKSPIHNF